MLLGQSQWQAEVPEVNPRQMVEHGPRRSLGICCSTVLLTAPGKPARLIPHGELSEAGPAAPRTGLDTQ